MVDGRVELDALVVAFAEESAGLGDEGCADLFFKSAKRNDKEEMR